MQKRQLPFLKAKKPLSLVLILSLLLTGFVLPQAALAKDSKLSKKAGTNTLVDTQKESAAKKTAKSKEAQSIRVKETGQLFATLTEAISATGSTGLSTFTLEIIGDVTETANVTIESKVTVAGAEGKHTITTELPIKVQNGGKLTLGDGSETNLLTISSTGDTVSVLNGSVSAKDGILLKSTGSYALHLNSTSATGNINGGRFDGNRAALHMEAGATISEISGGAFVGEHQEGIYLTDAGTRIEKITGGKFYQTDPDTLLHGQAVFVQNNAQIGEISGGYFEATRDSAMLIIRGGWIDNISGGQFVAKRTGSAAGNDRTSAVCVESEGTKTGIGTISGGHFSGGFFGLLTINRKSQGAQIDSITGGTFRGNVALQNDLKGLINDISGGEFNGNQGMLNAGTIGNIGGQANIKGNTSYGIYNYANAQINQISGGTICSDSYYGIMNAGTIKLISGGRMIGILNAINCTGLTGGTLTKITGGVFWGKESTAINLASKLTLEPGLDVSKGFGRYWGKDGVIFNDENLVEYPYNHQVKEYYEMSTKTLPVNGIDQVAFKYLTLPSAVDYKVTVEGSYADITGEGFYEEGDTVTIHAGSREGYIFTGWQTKENIVLKNADSAKTTFVMPDNDVTVTATWKSDGENKTTKPDEPEKPDKTGNSETPAKTGTSGKPETQSRPQTGDIGLLPILLYLVGFSLIAIGFTCRTGKRQRKDNVK